jgi:4-amino-4-deoxychorismate lyase
MTLFARLDGAVRPARDALIPATDSAVLLGDGVFETILVADGRPLDLAKHQARLALSAAIVDIDTPPAEAWAPAVDALIRAYGRGTREGREAQAAAGGAGTVPTVDAIVATERSTSERNAFDRNAFERSAFERNTAERNTAEIDGGATDFVLRLTSTRSGEHFATAAPVPPRTLHARAGISVVLAPDPFHRTVPYTTTIAKTLSYATNLAALRYARTRGADDVIFLQPDGTVTEGPTATVVLARGGELITPGAPGILPAITAARLGPRVQPVTAQDLVTADSIYLVSAIRLAAPVVMLDGRRRPHDAALTERLRRTLRHVG